MFPAESLEPFLCRIISFEEEYRPLREGPLQAGVADLGPAGTVGKVGQDLELVMIGSHEDYYRDLKQYLKNR